MRRLGYALLALVLLLAIAPLASLLWTRWEAWRNLEPVRAAGLDERVLFEPVDGQALAFNTSTHQGWFALEGFLVAAPASRARELPVTLDIGLRGKRGTTTERRYVALPAVDRAQPYGLLDGEPGQAVWIMPTVWVDLADRPDVRAVTVRVVDAGEAVRTVLWRGALDERLSDREVGLRYRRLSSAAREALTAEWITPPGLVDPKVKQELLRFRQLRVAPLGRQGELFVARSVLRQAPDGALRQYDPRIGALAIDAGLAVSVELGASRRVTVDARGRDGRPLAVTVDGSRADGSGAARTLLSSAWTGDWAAGRYVLRSAAPGIVDVRDASSGESLLPSGLRPRTHRASPDRALDYVLVALDGAPPPVRLRLRPERGGAVVSLRFLDAARAVIDSRDIALTARPSQFDRLAADLDRAVAEPLQIDLTPPAAARGLQVGATAPVLVHALTTLSPGVRGRRWYSFEPELDPDSVASQGVVVVEQPQPGSARTIIASTEGDAIAGKASRPREPHHTAHRPRLRLRAERDDSTEPADAD